MNEKNQNIIHNFIIGMEKDKKLKRCSNCKQTYLATSEFFHKHNGRKDGLDPWCKECKKEYHKTYYKLKKYKLSKAGYEKILEEQDNRCAICGIKFDEIFSRYKYPHDYDPDIDHNHKTGKIRGITCLNCNRAIGRCKENPLILIKAVKYLQENKKKRSKKFMNY